MDKKKATAPATVSMIREHTAKGWQAAAAVEGRADCAPTTDAPRTLVMPSIVIHHRFPGSHLRARYTRVEGGRGGWGG